VVANRRVRVTARSRQNDRFRAETVSSILRWQHPFKIEDTNWHRSEQLPARVRMEAGRVGGCEVQGGHQDQAPSVGRQSALRVTRPRKTFLIRKEPWGLRAPPVGRRSAVVVTRPTKPLLTQGGLLMEAATVRERTQASACAPVSTGAAARQARRVSETARLKFRAS